MSEPPAARPPALPLLIIAAIVATIGALFAWTAGWVGPARVSGGTLADALEYNAGLHRGYRRAHAKGMCIAGRFDANGAGAHWSKATVFRTGSSTVIGRLSTGGGNPLATDGRNVFHAMALRIVAADGQEWRTAMDHTPIFPVADVKSFVALQIATKPDPKTGKPDPARLAAYLAEHPETARFMAYMKTMPLPNSFANGTYHSINAYRFIDGDGAARAVRWRMVPEDRLVALDKDKLAALPDNILFDGFIDRLKAGPVRWHLIVTFANPGDVTNNATVQWTGPHRQVDVGTLTIDRSAPEETGGCRDYVYDPTVLPPGIAPSDDPLLSARSAVYSTSYTRRAKEGSGPSAIGGQTGLSGKQP